MKVAIELKGNAYTKEELEGDVVRPAQFVSKEEIAQKARSLMPGAEGEFVRKNMQQILRAKSRDAGAPGGSSRRNFDTYVRLLSDLQRS